MNREVEKGRALDDTEAQQVVASLIKQRRDSIEQFLKGGRGGTRRTETAEIAVARSLPSAAGGSCGVERAVDEAIAERARPRRRILDV